MARRFFYISIAMVAFLATQASYAQTAKPFLYSNTCLPVCAKDSVAFTIFGDTVKKVTAWKWTFDDAASALKNTSKLQNPKHEYNTPGVKNVKLVRNYANGTKDSVTIQVTINTPPPAFYLGNTPAQTDTTICKGDSIQLDPYKGGAPAGRKLKYLWFPKGDTTQTTWASKAGCYSVEVFDSLTGCSYQNRINVKICIEQPPQTSSKWYFGDNAGLEFPSGGGTATANAEGKIKTKEGVSYINDALGNLLFYTDGRDIYDSKGKLIKTDSTKLGGSENSTQSAVIVPQPSCQGCQAVYYIFTTNEINGKRQLSYSIVDMRKNQGKGEVTKKNIPLFDNTTERLTTIFNTKDSSYWVLSHDYNSNTFRSYRVTKNGVSDAKTINIGIKQDSVQNGKGYLKASPDGKKIAIAVPGPPRNYVELFDFNDSTGVIKNKITLDLGPAPPPVYGVEFSPDGKRLYVTLSGDSAKKTESRLLEFDLSKKDSASIAKSKVTIDSSKTQTYGAIQIAPDGRIYMAIKGSTTLAYIEKPNAFTRDSIAYKSSTTGLSLGGKTSQLGLPATIKPPTDSPSGTGIMVSDTCVGNPTTFQSSPLCDPLKDLITLWKFGDGSSAIGTPGQPTTHTYAQAGTYKVELFIQNKCKDTTITQNVTIKPAPKVDLGPDISECKNSVVLNANATGGTGIRYRWIVNNGLSPKDSLSKLTATQSGKYKVIAALNGCVAVDDINVKLTAAKPFNAGKDTSICRGNSLVLDANIIASSYLWSTGETTRRITITQAGTYIVKITDDATNCKNADTLKVTFRNKPTFTLSITPTTACLSTNGAASLNNLSPAGTYSFQWYKAGTVIGGNTPNLTGLAAGGYSVAVRSSQTCDTLVPFSVGSVASNLNFSLQKTNAACNNQQGGSIRINRISGTPNAFNLINNSTQTVVRTGAFTNTIDFLPSGNYTLEISDANGCKWTQGNIQIGLDPARSTTLPKDTTLCNGATIVLDAGSFADKFLWSTGATTQKITVSQSGTYKVTATDTKANCVGTFESKVTFVPKPNVLTSVPTVICANAKPLFFASSPVGGVWSGVGITPKGIFTPSPNMVGNQTVTYKYAIGGCADSSKKTFAIQAVPLVDLGKYRAFCADGTTYLSAPEVTGGTYRWSTGETTSTILPTQSGTYTVTLSQGVCKASDTVKVDLLSVPSIFLRGEVPLCVPEGGLVTLNPTGTITSDLKFLWTPTGQTTKSITVNTPGKFILKATNAAGCINQQKAEVIDLCDPRIYVPEVFTPNGDNRNDQLDVYTAYLFDPELRIFNRWGEVMYATKDLSQRWDGTYKGVACTSDSYAWVITYFAEYYPNKGLLSKRGAVVLAR